MNVANITRAAIFISAILLVVAVALDEYLTADVDGGDADFGAFNSIYSVAGDKYDVKVDCADNALSTECSDSCTSKQAFAALSAIFAWLSVGVTTSFPEIYLATTDRVRNVLSGVMTQMATLFVLIVLVMFGVEKRITSDRREETGVCAYKLENISIDLGPSYIIMIVAGIICGLAGTIQLVVNPDRNIGTAHDMTYGYM